MAAGMLLSVLTFAVAWLALRRKPWKPGLGAWIAVAISATSAGTLLGLGADTMYYESYGVGGWLFWSFLLAAGIASPLLGAHALMSGRSVPTFLELIGPADYRGRSWSVVMLGLVLIVTTVIGADTAVGLAFDPRYKDFPFAALTMAVVPLAGLSLLNRPKEGSRPIAEATFAALLVMTAIFTGFNEGADNWQSLWTCGMYVLLGATLWRARVAQTPK
jgi:glucan 1,3-beta-glucosidase